MTGLIADIGGTNARFALVEGEEITDIEQLQTKDHESLSAAITSYLQGKNSVTSAAIGVPCTIYPDRKEFSFVNNPAWNFLRTEFEETMGWHNLVLVNDFLAIAHGVPYLTEADVVQVGGGAADPEAVKTVVGPGTGLGTAVVAYHEGRPVPLAGQGGHVTYPAVTEREYAIVKYLLDNGFEHVSAENLISGNGMVNVYQAIAALEGAEVPERDAAEISQAGLDEKCPVCMEVLEHFCAMLGTIARNLALSPMSFGGVYIAGGIVPKFGEYFANSRFRERFEGSGNMRRHIERIPTYVITHPYPAFVGLKSLL